MKNNLLKYYIAVFCLCSTVVMFAQDPGINGGVENDGSSDAAPMPIDDYIWVLAAIGLVFVFMKYRAIQNRRINS